MKILPFLLSACLLASVGCDIGDFDLNLRSELLTVNVMTLGANLDADGYTLSVTSQLDESININDTRTFSVLRIDITVELLGVAGNCTVDANPQTVTVRGPTTLAFFVECT